MGNNSLEIKALRNENHNLQMANGRLRVTIEGLEQTIENYRENIRQAIARNIMLEDDIRCKENLIATLTEDRDRLRKMIL